jgi:hypothetical protein
VLGHTVSFALQRIIHDAYFELRLDGPGERPNVSAHQSGIAVIAGICPAMAIRRRQGDVADVPGQFPRRELFERSLLLPRLWLNLRLDRRRGLAVCGWLFAE